MMVSVVLADSTRAFDREYTYLVPEDMSLLPGMRVLVPFGMKNALRDGWVVAVQDGESDAPPAKKIRLKTVSEQIDQEPLLGADLIRLAGWMRDRFFCTWHQALSCMLPSGARLIQKTDGSYGRRDAGKTRRAMTSLLERDQFEAMVCDGVFKSLHHVHVLEALFDEGICPVEELYLLPGVSSGTLLTMKKKGWIAESLLEVDRDPFSALSVKEVPAPDPTEEQDAAFAKLAPLLAFEGADSSGQGQAPADGHPSGENHSPKENHPSADTQAEGFPEALVYGVTGSGKTELYLRLIEECLKNGRGAIMLVPEISLTPQTVERFLARFGTRVAVLHSRLSMGERYDQWRRIRSGELDVVVGARSAVFAPLKKLGAILIDEEHEGAYKAENTPRYDARLVARARCNLSGSLLVYGSATPSLETFHRAEQGKIIRVDLRSRVAGRPLPDVTLVDMRQELENGNRSHFSGLLERELADVRKSGEQAILFLNRRGVAAFLLCRDCGHVVRCPNCSVSLSLHRQGRLVCHHCGHLEPLPGKCPSCQGSRLLPVGMGTQKLERDLANHTEGYRVVRMDLDTTTGKEGHRRQLDIFRSGEADILVGTQMVAKGHDFPNVTLVGILSADAMLATGDYRASERTFQLLAQAAGRAGRAGKPGRVVIQAYNVDDYSLQAVLTHDFEGFFRQEIALRKKLWLPPFSHIGMILVTSPAQEKAEEGSRQVSAWLENQVPGTPGLLTASGMPAPIPLLGGRHRMRILVRHVQVRVLKQVLTSLLDVWQKPLASRETDVTVDIDPGSMV